MLDRFENDQRLAVIWADIELNVQTDANALDIFCHHWQELGLVRCPRCSGESISRNPGEREGECNDCGEACWVTSGTILQRVTLFKGYLAAARFLEEGLTISGPEFSRLTGIPGTSSYNISRKFRVAIADEMPEKALEFSGILLKLLIAKRTQETPANCHPFAEQELIDDIVQNTSDESSDDASDAHCENAEEGYQSDDTLSDYEKVKKVVASLLSDVGLTADTISLKTGIAIGKVIAGLSELELFGDARVEPGGKYFKAYSADQMRHSHVETAQEIIEALNIFVGFIFEYFHRVGRKGVQTYLASFWCALDRERWGKNSMLRLCGEHPPIPYRQLLKYVSAPFLKVVVG